MLKLLLHALLLVSVIGLSGCGIKHEISTSKAYLVTIKTPQRALSDTGFLNQADGYTQLQVFNAGTLLFNLEMTHEICLDGRCLEKREFNKYFFGVEHYETLMNDIIDKKELYSGQNRVDTAEGFSQEIHLKNADIVYKIEGDTRYFKDTKNSVLFRLKPLQP